LEDRNLLEQSVGCERVKGTGREKWALRWGGMTEVLGSASGDLGKGVKGEDVLAQLEGKTMS